MVYMVYKNIQSLASGETKDIIIHIGPILHMVERNPCTGNRTWIYPSPCQKNTLTQSQHKLLSTRHRTVPCQSQTGLQLSLLTCAVSQMAYFGKCTHIRCTAYTLHLL